MMTAWLMIAGLTVAGLVGAYIFWPYFEPGERPERRRDDMKTSVGDDPEEALMSELAQLEYDFRSGKLRPDDYEGLRADLETRLLRLRTPDGRVVPDQPAHEEAGEDARAH